MTTAPWWTEADQAEWDLVLWTVVDAIFDLPRADPRTAIIIALAVDWCSTRSLVSRAEWLRRRHLTAYLDEIAAAEPVVPF